MHAEIRSRLLEHFAPLAEEEDEEWLASGWTRAETQGLIFPAICELFAHETGPFSIYDVGCGLGTFAEYLAANFPQASYTGCDISEPSLRRARKLRPGIDVELQDIVLSTASPRDYIVCAGALDDHHGFDGATWWQYITSVMHAMWKIGRKGIGLSFLSSRVDWRDPRGYYVDPTEALRFSLDELSRLSEIRHAPYPFRFSLFVYRDPRPIFHAVKRD